MRVYTNVESPRSDHSHGRDDVRMRPEGRLRHLYRGMTGVCLDDPPYVGLEGELPASAERLLCAGRGLLDTVLRMLPQPHGDGEPFSPDVYSAVVPRLWLLAAPAPLKLTTPHNWKRLFDVAGLTSEGVRIPRPTRSTRLYRGGSPDGWSWTPDPEMAMAFASGMGKREPEDFDPLWTALAPPEALLAWVPLLSDPTTRRTIAEECVAYPPYLQEHRAWTQDEIDATPLPVVQGDGHGRMEVVPSFRR